MEWIDPRQPAPEKAKNRGEAFNLADILAGYHKAGHNEEQIDKQVEVQGVLKHEAPRGVILYVV